MYSRIVGCGSYLPKKILTNRDLETMVDTSDEWIFTRTGIRQRHIAADNENASDLALNASKKAMQAAAVKAGDIDLIIVATTTPDMIFPGTACLFLILDETKEKMHVKTINGLNNCYAVNCQYLKSIFNNMTCN